MICGRISGRSRKTNDILRMICGNVIEKMAANILFHSFSVTIVVTMVATVVLNGCSGCSRWLEWLEPIESATARGVLYATAIVSTIEVIRMVLLPADYLRQKFIEPLKERQKEEGREEGQQKKGVRKCA